MERLLSMITLTNMHIGTPGSAVSVVDNPIYRDSFGKIVIRGENLKGAVRSALFLVFKQISNDEEIVQNLLDNLLGSMESISALSFLDAPLIFIPTTALGFKVLYVTSPELLLHLITLSDDALSNNDRETLDKIVSYLEDIEINDVYLYPPGNKKILDFAKDISLNINENSSLIKPIYDLLQSILKWSGVNEILEPFGLAVVSDSIFNQICDRSLFIRPRIKIKGLDAIDNSIEIYSKRVDENIGTWFEEEIPKFSIFVTKLKATRTSDLELRVTKNERSNEVKEIIGRILNITFSISIKKNNAIYIDREKLLNAVINRINSIYIGGNEALNKGLVKIIPIKSLGIQSPNLPKDKKEKKISTPMMEKNVRELTEIVKSINGDHASKAKEIQGKFSALPERIKQLGLIAAYLFYTRLKSDVSGKGYSEVREVLRNLTGEKLDRERFIVSVNNEYSRIDPNKIIEYIVISEKTIRGATMIKYIIRSYVKAPGGDLT